MFNYIVREFLVAEPQISEATVADTTKKGPPPPALIPVPIGSDGMPIYGTSLYEPNPASGIEAAEALPIIDEKNLVLLAQEPGAKDAGGAIELNFSSPPPLPAILRRVRTPPNPTLVADVDIDDNRLTIGPPVQAPETHIVRAIVRNASVALPKGRRVRVVIGSIGPANDEERSWVVGGSTGLGIAVRDGELDRPRLVVVHIAFIVHSYESDGSVVYGDVRWFGLLKDRERAWKRKFETTDGGQRKAEFVAGLEQFFAYAAPRIGMAVSFLGGPATSGDVAAREGYQWWAPGCPAVKVSVNMSRVGTAIKEAQEFYLGLQGGITLGIRRWFWRHFWPELEAKFLLGEDFESKGAPKPQVEDGLKRNERAQLMTMVAEIAGPAVSSLGKIAWQGDKAIETALMKRDLGPVQGTTYTIMEVANETQGE